MFPKFKISGLVVKFLVAVLLPASACLGQEVKTSRLDLQYTRTFWGVSDGLPEDTVKAIVESGDGMLWIGTTGGLTRFDGAHLHLWGTGPEQSLPVNSIFCLARGNDGSLWAGTEGGGLLRIRGSSLMIYSRKDGLTDGSVRSVHEDERGRLWVGTDNGLFVLQNDRLRRVKEAADIAPLACQARWRRDRAAVYA